MTSTLVIVDMGYLLFYRYHATLRYLRCGGKDASRGVDPQMFAKHLRAQLRAITDRFPGCGPLVVCSDAPRATLWRRELFPEYKARRGAAPAQMGELAAMFVDIVRERGDVLLEVPRVEADDLAFMTTRLARDHAQLQQLPIAIITNDRDYVQLCAHFQGVRLYDAALRPVLPASGDAGTDFRIKLLAGDKSDNIPGVCAAATARRWLAPDATPPWPPADLSEAKLRRLRDNELLMDMRLIPNELQQLFAERCAPLVLEHHGHNKHQDDPHAGGTTHPHCELGG